MAMTVEDREVAELLVARARAILERGDKLGEVFVADCAKAVKRKPRTFRRWISQGVPDSARSDRASLTEPQNDAFFEALGNCVRANRLLEARGHDPLPIRKYQRMVKRDLTARQVALAREGPASASRYSLFMERREKGRAVCFEADHKQADVLVKKPRGRGNSNLIRPWITIVMDTFSRGIASVCISIRPTQAEVLSALGAAMNTHPELSPVYGVPEILRIDNGLEFTANAVTEATANFDIVVVHTPPYTPHKKGKVERLNRTIDDEVFSLMPFFLNGPRKKDGSLAQHKDMEAYPFDVFVSEVLDWVRFYNYKRPHQGIGGLTPAEKWNEDETPIRVISDAELRRFTLKRLDKGRVVTSLGIRAFNRNYTSIDLFDLVDVGGRVKEGDKVEVRYRPHDERSLEVYHRGRHLTTVYPHAKFTPSQRKAFSRKKQNRAQTLSRAATKAKKDARIRTAGVVAKGIPEEITLQEPGEYDRVETNTDRKMLEALGVDKKHGQRHNANRRGDH